MRALGRHGIDGRNNFAVGLMYHLNETKVYWSSGNHYQKTEQLFIRQEKHFVGPPKTRILDILLEAIRMKKLLKYTFGGHLGEKCWTCFWRPST
jgi:hypothetical protein